ncbi:SWIB/MDM2 domain-containing protein [Tupanvirus deep ocean]|uniref:SWIB/MDM2 domain-containing protein n=2 Tax=Tupanvirus TaxID=2094720 RepID=A0AC62A8X3_9VIRU|nr:SWIB/MDM2 domain-containing protein [Tupanvirus deep ocean]QKU34236.1 SWIB/MDM2 domain-containing protein [Tupanvirus deep ocean]
MLPKKFLIEQNALKKVMYIILYIAMSKNTKNMKKLPPKKITKKTSSSKEKIVLDLVDSDDDEIIENKRVTDTPNKKIKKVKNEYDEHDFDKKIEEIREALRENYAQQKKLMNDLKELMALHKKELKLSAKSGNRSNSGKHTGFNKPEPVPPPLKNLLKIEEDMLPRSTITKLMYQYFTDNKMYNRKTKKEIVPNKKIKEIFGMNDGDVINFYNLQTWLKKVYNENSATEHVLKIED